MALWQSGTATITRCFWQTEYEGRFFRQSDLSEDTVAWLESYNNLPEEGRKSISYVPYDLMPEDNTGITAMETDASAP